MTIVLQPTPVGTLDECRNCHTEIICATGATGELRGWRHTSTATSTGTPHVACELPDRAAAAEPLDTAVFDAGRAAGLAYGRTLPHGQYNPADYPTGYDPLMWIDGQYRHGTRVGEMEASAER
jgi:hypothetical protein